MSKTTENEFQNSDNEISEQLRKYLFLFVQNKYIIITLLLVGFITTYFYAKNLKNVYEAKVSIRVDKPQGNVLEQIAIPEFGGSQNYISNQMALIKSYVVRDIATNRLLDSLKKETSLSTYRSLVKVNSKKDTVAISDV